MAATADHAASKAISLSVETLNRFERWQCAAPRKRSAPPRCPTLAGSVDGSPFIIAEFVTHDSKLRFGSLNHMPGDTINRQRPIAADANTLNLLPLSGIQPTWRT